MDFVDRKNHPNPLVNMMVNRDIINVHYYNERTFTMDINERFDGHSPMVIQSKCTMLVLILTLRTSRIRINGSNPGIINTKYHRANTL